MKDKLSDQREICGANYIYAAFLKAEEVRGENKTFLNGLCKLQMIKLSFEIAENKNKFKSFRLLPSLNWSSK